MNISLMDFQEEYVVDSLTKLSRAKNHLKEGERQALLLSAPTGSGKTVMMASIMERLRYGVDGYELEAEPNAVFLWVSDHPELNEQSRNRILKASSLLREHQLIILGTDFDQERFEGGNIYFLNTQKLGKEKNLVIKGDKRTWTIWETINNTVQYLGDRFYVIIDEAHRGMNKTADEEADNLTIVQKLLVGSTGEVDAVPLVIGITATPERFLRFTEENDRHLYKVIVDPGKVRASGLIKDRLVVWVPEDSQPNDWSLLAAASKRWATMRNEWRTYCTTHGVDVVEPIMVVQVEDAKGESLTATDLAVAVKTIEAAVGTLQDRDIAHCFPEEGELSVAGHRIRHLDASKVDEDPDVKLVFFKMALTTGWDCPRAEIMMSFRHAHDATYIAQLIGRMVRTPLARRVEENELLNEVHLFLPYYETEEVNRVVEKLKADPDNVPATDVNSSSDLDELAVRQEPEFDRAFKALDNLPSYVFRQGRKLPDFRRLMRFAALLMVDGKDPEALPQAKSELVDVLVQKKTELASTDETFRQALEGNGTITVKSLSVDQVTFEVTEGSLQKVEITESNVEDLYRLSKQRLGDELCVEYLRKCHSHEQPLKAKLELYLLLQEPHVWSALEAAAKVLITKLKQKNQVGIQESERGHLYDEIWAAARIPEAANRKLPRKISLPRRSGGKSYQKHLFCDSLTGEYRVALKTWEDTVLTGELGSCIAWLRNEDRKPWALSYVYEMGGERKPGYPDFLVVRQVTGGPVVDILEPHTGALADAWAKARGMAAFARDHGRRFGRIEMERVLDHDVVRLDLNDPNIRERALRLTGGEELENLFRDCGTWDSSV